MSLLIPAPARIGMEVEYMVRATESIGMDWLNSCGINVPQVALLDGLVGEATPDLDFGPPWIVKPDVSVGSKGQMGLVRKCRTLAELRDATIDLSSIEINGQTPDRLVIEEFLPGDELYLSLAIDEEQRRAMLRVASKGGVGFDAATEAEALVVSLHDGLDLEEVQALLERAKVQPSELSSMMATWIERLWEAFVTSEALLVEINPVTWNGERASAVGIAVEFDDHPSAAAQLARPDIEWSFEASVGRPSTASEKRVLEANAAEPSRAGMKFLELDGDIGFLVLGGGASLFAFDYLHDRGFRPACYADFSPGAGIDKLTALFEAGLVLPNLRGVLVGSAVLSLMETDVFADALMQAITNSGIDPGTVPFAVRIAGPGEEKSRALLEAIPGIETVGREGTLEDACDVLIARLQTVTETESTK